MPDSLVTIATYPTPQQGHLAKGLLEAHDIPAAVLDEHIAGLVGPYTGYSEGVRLQVRASDVPDALEILDIPDEDEPLDGAPKAIGGPAQADICPLCGNPKPGWAALLRARIGAVLSASANARHQSCSACGIIREN